MQQVLYQLWKYFLQSYFILFFAVIIKVLIFFTSSSDDLLTVYRQAIGLYVNTEYCHFVNQLRVFW